MKEKRSLLRVLILLILGIIVFLGLIMYEVRSQENSMMKHTDEKTFSSLDDELSRRTNLGKSDLVGKNKQLFYETTQLLAKKKFIGAYIGTTGNKISLSGGRGYADQAKNSTFQLNSNLLVGEYQNFLNNAILVKLIDTHKVTLNDKLTDYMPKIKNSGSLRVRDLLLNRTNLVIKRKDINKTGSAESKKSNLSYFLMSKTRSKSYVSANTLLKTVIIAKVEHTSYENAVKRLLVVPLNLEDTRIYKYGIGYANDIKSYQYVKRNGTPIQSKLVKTDKLYYGINELRMPLSDIVLSSTDILQNKYFSKKLNSIFYKSVNQSENSMSIKNGKFNFNDENMGQYLCLKYDLKRKELVAVITNFPNKLISVEKVNKKLFNILN